MLLQSKPQTVKWNESLINKLILVDRVSKMIDTEKAVAIRKAKEIPRKLVLERVNTLVRVSVPCRRGLVSIRDMH